jgi:replicative DNA helicase
MTSAIGTIYETLVEMYDGKEPIDSITVQQRDCGTGSSWMPSAVVAYLSSLPDSVPSAANIGFYLNVVRGEVHSAADDPGLHGRRQSCLRV